MQKIEITGTSRGSIEIKGLTPEQVENLKGTILGVNWFQVINNKPIFVPTHAPLPDAIKDEAMLPFWRKCSPGMVEAAQQVLFDQEMYRSASFASIMIQHLCGYYYTPQNYTHEAEKLESYGFVQMRSKRSEDGRYHEGFYLADLLFAEGELKDVILLAETNLKTNAHLTYEKKKILVLKTALEFLRTHVIFGSLDVSVQKFAMPHPD